MSATERPPNILLVMLDDVGFGDTSTFGGPIHTPVLDQLAAAGLRYNRFHTNAICSPTRASLLSGRNHHQVGYGGFGGAPYAGYDGVWKKNVVSVAEVLKRNGYSTAAFGKWHNTPYREISPVGPFDRWPTGLGFEYFYGNLLGVSSQWEPLLWRNTEMVAPPATPEQGYHFTTDITDEAICWLRTHETLAAEKPYFIYFAPQAAHAPHHVSPKWIEKYSGKFSQGWDKLREETFSRQKALGVIPPAADLTPRPEELPAWDSLSSHKKRLYARQMEVFAGFVEHTDYEIGRLIQVVKQGTFADNTLILFVVGDNGDEAAEGIDGTDNRFAKLAGVDDPLEIQAQRIDELGGPLHQNQYAAGWAWAGSTPFQWMKHIASHFGGTRNPLVVSWPARIKDHGGLRSQFAHVNDVAPTLYEAAGVEFPEVIDGVRQLPLAGISLLETFDDANNPGRHRVQYFESEGNRAIYQDGWLAAARHSVPWVHSTFGTPSNRGFDQDRWELYDLERDFSQAHDLAARYPNKLKALQELFDTEARKNGVYPLDGGTRMPPPEWSTNKRKYVFYPGSPTMLMMGLPDMSQSHRIVADAFIPESGVNGVILSAGGRSRGLALYVKDGRLVYELNVLGKRHQIMTSKNDIPRGKVEFTFELRRQQGSPHGIGQLHINGKIVSEAQLDYVAPDHSFFIEPFDIGQNSISAVSNSYAPPFKFSGILEKVTIESI